MKYVTNILTGSLERHVIALFCVLAFMGCLIGCERERPAGIVATVNGEPITLHSLQTLMDSRTGAMGISPRPSLAEMKGDYGRALGVLVAHALVRQDLAQRGIEVGAGDFDQTVREIADDLGEDNLDAFMKDASMRKSDWLELMRDYLALETFRNQVLLPAIKIDREEARKFYNEHAPQFSLPDNLHICLVTSENRDEIDAWCSDFAQKTVPSGFVAQCVDAVASDIPVAWQGELKNLKAWNCAKPRHENNEWQTIGLVSREKGRVAPLGEVYALIENMLLAEKQNEAFNNWLEQKIMTADIRVVPELAECLVIASLPELQDAPPITSAGSASAEEAR